MPGRKKKIYTDGIYHVFNKTIDSVKIFEDDSNCKLFMRTLEYYRSIKARIGLATINRMIPDIRQKILQEIQIAKYFRIEILAYTLMPTHYHLLIHQLVDDGVSKFIGDSINSFTRHLNVKGDRQGPLFLTKFKAVPIFSDEQLMHVSRYIHLNPYSAGLIQNIQSLTNYPWSSYSEYLNLRKGIANVDLVMKLFGNNAERYKKFIEDHADYQKTLEFVKHAERLI